MARTVKVTSNETHWQSRHVAQLVRLCADGAGCVPETQFEIQVEWSDSGDCWVKLSAITSLRHRITISLPKRGRQSTLHPLVQLGQSALGKDGPRLPLHQTYRLAQSMTLLLARRTVTKQYGKRQREKRIHGVAKGHRPYWIPEEFSILKYAPAKKREDPRSFIEKVEDDIAKAEARIEKWEAEIEHAEAHLDRAQKDLKKHQRRLREAKKRRSAS